MGKDDNPSKKGAFASRALFVTDGFTKQNGMFGYNVLKLSEA